MARQWEEIKIPQEIGVEWEKKRNCRHVDCFESFLSKNKKKDTAARRRKTFKFPARKPFCQSNDYDARTWCHFHGKKLKIVRLFLVTRRNEKWQEDGGAVEVCYFDFGFPFRRFCVCVAVMQWEKMAVQDPQWDTQGKHSRRSRWKTQLTDFSVLFFISGKKDTK